MLVGDVSILYSTEAYCSKELIIRELQNTIVYNYATQQKSNVTKISSVTHSLITVM